MSDQYDAIVVGVGGMGSATAYHLASRGVETLGIEQYDIPHQMGSSHGVTRIIRKAQYEDPAYVPLVRRAYDLWRDLEERSGRDLLHITGGIDAGPPGGALVSGSRRCCETHDIPYETLTGAEVNERFPGYDLPPDHRAIYQADGGFLVPEQCIVAYVQAAQAEGADIRAREAVTDYTPRPDGTVSVDTTKGSYEADELVVTAGAWAREFLPGFADKLVPVRQVLGWFQPSPPEQFAPDAFPVFIHGTEDDHYYGFPEYDVPGFKIGKFNHLGEAVDPDAMAREPRPEDEEVLRSYTERCFPGGAGATMRLSTCLFTNTPDWHFILDTHPDHPQVTVGAGFSGHGFKFASAVGEVLADLAIDGRTDHDIDLFSATRFE